jgi:hypothetical protein
MTSKIKYTSKDEYPSVTALVTLADDIVHIMQLCSKITQKLEEIELDEDMLQDMVENVLDELETQDAKKVKQTISDLYAQTLDDCKKILDEADEFCECIMTSKSFEEKCPFLYEIWAGDAYDKEGYESIHALRKELELKNGLSTPDGLVVRTIKYLKK